MEYLINTYNYAITEKLFEYSSNEELWYYLYNTNKRFNAFFNNYCGVKMCKDDRTGVSFPVRHNDVIIELETEGHKQSIIYNSGTNTIRWPMSHDSKTETPISKVITCQTWEPIKFLRKSKSIVFNTNSEGCKYSDTTITVKYLFHTPVDAFIDGAIADTQGYMSSMIIDGRILIIGKTKKLKVDSRKTTIRIFPKSVMISNDDSYYHVFNVSRRINYHEL